MFDGQQRGEIEAVSGRRGVLMRLSTVRPGDETDDDHTIPPCSLHLAAEIRLRSLRLEGSVGWSSCPIFRLHLQLDSSGLPMLILSAPKKNSVLLSSNSRKINPRGQVEVESAFSFNGTMPILIRPIRYHADLE